MRANHPLGDLGAAACACVWRRRWCRCGTHVYLLRCTLTSAASAQVDRVRRASKQVNLSTASRSSRRLRSVRVCFVRRQRECDLHASRRASVCECVWAAAREKIHYSASEPRNAHAHTQPPDSLRVRDFETPNGCRDRRSASTLASSTREHNRYECRCCCDAAWQRRCTAERPKRQQSARDGVSQRCVRCRTQCVQTRKTAMALLK